MGVIFVSYSGIEVTAIGTPAFLAAGFLFLAAFLWIDARNPANRLLPRRPFDPLLMTSMHGASALAVGHVVAGIALGWTFAAIVVSGAPERRDPIFIATGMLLVAASLVGLAYAMPSGPVWLIAVFATM